MNKLTLALLFLTFALHGCCSLSEGARGFMGVSTKILEDTRKDAVTKDFNISLEAAHSAVKTALRENKSYIYREDDSFGLIAVYLSESDTTPVGVFLSSLDNDKVRIEVSSPSTYGKETIAKVVFDALKGILDEKKE